MSERSSNIDLTSANINIQNTQMQPPMRYSLRSRGTIRVNQTRTNTVIQEGSIQEEEYWERSSLGGFGDYNHETDAHMPMDGIEDGWNPSKAISPSN